TRAARAAGRLLARRVPRVDGDRRRRAAVAEVADHQHVAGLVHAAEAGAAADAVAAQPDRVLEEPEALLRVAAVVEAVRAEEQHLALCRVVPRGEAVQQVVLVGQPARAVLPRPLIDVLRVLGPAAGEDGGVRVRLGDPVDCESAGRVVCRGAVGAGDLVTDVVPVVTQYRGIVGRVAVELERAGVVHRLRTGDEEERGTRDQEYGRDQKTASPPAPLRPEYFCCHPDTPFVRGFRCHSRSYAIRPSLLLNRRNPCISRTTASRLNRRYGPRAAERRGNFQCFGYRK